MSIVERARAEIRSMKPYSSARMESSSWGVMLNANELPFSRDGSTLNRYPDPQPAALVRSLAGLYGVEEDCVLVGRGSDEPIDLLVRAFCRAGLDSIIVCPPTFGMYAFSARTQNADVIEVPLDAHFEFDEQRVFDAVTPATKLVFLCSPNNPTGNATTLDVIERTAQALAGRAVLVVDEAYIEFSGNASAATLLEEHTNLAILRTLSKAYGLAGIRIGCLLAHPDVISLLRRIQAPYPLSTPCVDLALGALDSGGLRRTLSCIATVCRERERVVRELRQWPDVVVLPSVANFVCVSFPDRAAAYDLLHANGIVVRDVSGYRGLSNCLRITIGSADENDKLINALAHLWVAA